MPRFDARAVVFSPRSLTAVAGDRSSSGRNGALSIPREPEGPSLCRVQMAAAPPSPAASRITVTMTLPFLRARRVGPTGAARPARWATRGGRSGRGGCPGGCRGAAGKAGVPSGSCARALSASSGSTSASSGLSTLSSSREGSNAISSARDLGCTPATSSSPSLVRSDARARVASSGSTSASSGLITSSVSTPDVGRAPLVNTRKGGVCVLGGVMTATGLELIPG